MPWQTTIENVTFGPKMRGERKEQNCKKRQELADWVGLGEFMNKFTQLSVACNEELSWQER